MEPLDFTEVRVGYCDVRGLCTDVRERWTEVRELFCDVRVLHTDVRERCTDVRELMSEELWKRFSNASHSPTSATFDSTSASFVATSACSAPRSACFAPPSACLHRRPRPLYRRPRPLVRRQLAHHREMSRRTSRTRPTIVESHRPILRSREIIHIRTQRSNDCTSRTATSGHEFSNRRRDSVLRPRGAR